MIAELTLVGRIAEPNGEPTLDFRQKWQRLVSPPVYTVAELPEDASYGAIAYASDLRVFNGTGTQEGSGNGTGGSVTYTPAGWVIVGTNVAAVA